MGKAKDFESRFEIHFSVRLRYSIEVLFLLPGRWTNRLGRSAFLLRCCCDQIVDADPNTANPRNAPDAARRPRRPRHPAVWMSLLNTSGGPCSTNTDSNAALANGAEWSEDRKPAQLHNARQVATANAA